jgi:hypothetical protein
MKILSFKKLSGRSGLLESNLVTQGEYEPNLKMTNKTMRKNIVKEHGTLDHYIFEVVAIIPDRVHTHIRTHNLINRFYACSTSRPDLTDTDGKERIIKFLLPLKRFIEIYSVRSCPTKTWVDTTKFIKLLGACACKEEPALKGLLVSRCTREGYCRNADMPCKHRKIMTGKCHDGYKKLVKEILEK